MLVSTRRSAYVYIYMHLINGNVIVRVLFVWVCSPNVMLKFQDTILPQRDNAFWVRN